MADVKLKAYFEELYGKKLTEAEVLDYKQKLVRFFSLLIEIDQQNKKRSNETQSI
ncbi:MAG: hypothetical protein UR98_C0017G0016 [Parcubacteria group bacterium GW2011_GWA1_36_12]|nr:MAG: hypothetical protein UR98_C0017G0016 [Parcubacteria group bacterium GW2011_GWA1_36_12]